MQQERPPESPAEHLRRVLTAHGPALQRIASSWTRSASERDDLLQDMSLALLHALPKFRQECPERAFVWRIAYNCALALAGKRRRAGETDSDAVIDRQVSPLPSPQDQLELHERRVTLYRAIRLLRDEQRVLVTLSLEGFTLEEIGLVVGCSANVVGVRLHRARAALLAHVEAVSRAPQQHKEAR